MFFMNWEKLRSPSRAISKNRKTVKKKYIVYLKIVKISCKIVWHPLYNFLWKESEQGKVMGWVGGEGGVADLGFWSLACLVFVNVVVFFSSTFSERLGFIITIAISIIIITIIIVTTTNMVAIFHKHN